MTRSVYSHGVTATTDNSVLITPDRFAGDGTIPGIIYCHGGFEFLGGWGSTGFMDPVNAYAEFNIIQALSRHWPVMASDLGGEQTWGNSTVTAAVEQARLALVAAGAKSGKIGLLGVSMGHSSAIQYANANLANVACVGAIEPLCDMGVTYAENPFGDSPAIATAWGVTYPNPLPAAAEVKGMAATLNGLPWEAWCSSGDTIVPVATVQTFGANIGGVVNVTNTNDHGQANISAAPINQLIDFYFTNLGAWQG